MNPQTIKELRGQIDTLDDQILELLLKRIQLSNSIMRSKAPGQIVDPQREAEIYRRYTEKLGATSTPAKVRQVVQALVAASSLYPEAQDR